MTCSDGKVQLVPEAIIVMVYVLHCNVYKAEKNLELFFSRLIICL